MGLSQSPSMGHLSPNARPSSPSMMSDKIVRLGHHLFWWGGGGIGMFFPIPAAPGENLELNMPGQVTEPTKDLVFGAAWSSECTREFCVVCYWMHVQVLQHATPHIANNPPTLFS